jgi:hypothetical protein
LGSCVACPAGKFRDAGDFETASVTQCCIDPERPCLSDDGPQADHWATPAIIGLFGAIFWITGLCVHGTCAQRSGTWLHVLLKEAENSLLRVATAKILSKRFSVSNCSTTYFVDYVFEGTAANGQPFRLAAKDDTSIPSNVWEALPETPTLQATAVQLEVTFLAEEPEHCLLTAQITEDYSMGCCEKTFFHIAAVGFLLLVLAVVLQLGHPTLQLLAVVGYLLPVAYATYRWRRSTQDPRQRLCPCGAGPKRNKTLTTISAALSAASGPPAAAVHHVPGRSVISTAGGVVAAGAIEMTLDGCTTGAPSAYTVHGGHDA